jgi:hypothetical protein
MSETSSALEVGEANLPPPGMTESSSTPTEDGTELPPPIEIAKVAAILSRDRNLDRRKAIDEAIALCLEAGIRYAELVELTADQILKEVGDATLLDWALQRANRRKKKLRLYPDEARPGAEIKNKFFQGDLDQVRAYLQKKPAYLNMRKTRSVLSTIELYFLKTAHDHNLRNKEKIEELEKSWARLAKQRTKEMRRTVTVEEIRNGWQLTENDAIRRDGDREYEDFMNEAAVRADGISEGHHFRLGKVRYWELTEDFLDKLINFRRRLKEAHVGIRDLEAELKQRATAKRGKKG